MGNTATNQETIEDQEEDGQEIVETEEGVSDESQESQETEEVEIVRESEGSQPPGDIQSGIRKRINKLNTKVAIANEETSEVNTALALERERTKILEIALEQAKQNKQVPLAPNPDDFDDGTSDPGFLKKQEQYTQSIIQEQVATQVAEATKQNQTTASINAQSQALQQKQVMHYERANGMKTKDYAETEDKALAVLGNEIANQMIGNFDDAHNILYYLGKNIPEAESLANLINSNPIQGVAEIGRLRSELKIKPKSKTAPDPDKEITGDSPKQGQRGPKGATYS